VRVHAQRILTEKKVWSPKYAAMAKLGLEDKEGFVQRVAVEALAAHPAADHVTPIIALRNNVPANDRHLYYATRLALREQLKLRETWKPLRIANWPAKEQHAVADVCLGLRHEPSAEFLKTYLVRFEESVPAARAYIHYIVRYGADGSVPWVLNEYLGRHPKNLAFYGNVLKAVAQAAQERGMKLTGTERTSAEAIVDELLHAPQPAEKQTGAELAGAFKLTNVRPTLVAMISAQGLSEAVRKACVTSLINIDAKQAVEPLIKLILNEHEVTAVREQVARDLGGTNHPEAHAALLKALQNAPARLEVPIALGLTGNKAGSEKLLQAIEAGKASPRVLQSRPILLRLQATKLADLDARIAKLTRGMPTADQKTQELIAKRRDAFVSFKADVEVGQKTFQKHCANCHQIANQGAKIGPQLDGIGIRGLERLLEDVLDPNRNVDMAFRTTVITTKDGKTINGLFLREEGNIVVLADGQGKDVRIEKTAIDDRAFSSLSPMPSNFAELMTEPELHHLVAYLLNQKGKSEK
jgi:putative heme-binding domain-containing protein